MTEGKCCGTCRFHRYDKYFDDWACENLNSDYFADFTEYDEGFFCEFYEERDPKPVRLLDFVEKAIRRVTKSVTPF